MSPIKLTEILNKAFDLGREYYEQEIANNLEEAEHANKQFCDLRWFAIEKLKESQAKTEPEDFELAQALRKTVQAMPTELVHKWQVLWAIDYALAAQKEQQATICPACHGSGEAKQDEHSAALQDVMNERQRQITAEGWTPEHDDGHIGGELAIAAACYAMHGDPKMCPGEWPWDYEHWKPTNRRSNLVKAGALILAEIERLDRIEVIKKPSVGTLDEFIKLAEEAGYKTIHDVPGLVDALRATEPTDQQSIKGKDAP